MNYFDCFAGPGRYEFGDVAVDGSPMIAVKTAKEFLNTRPNHSLNILLTENNEQQARQLEQPLGPLKPYPKNLSVNLQTEDSNTARVLAPVPDRTRCAAFAETFLTSFREMIRGSSLVQVGAGTLLQYDY
jgi:three-Cys-motif partner protein